MNFIPLKYRISWTEKGQITAREVGGFAFEIPGWPEFHACVRWGNRLYADSVFNEWIIDHFETGLGVSVAGALSSREVAPEVMRRVLDSIGKQRVHAALLRHGLTV